MFINRIFIQGRISGAKIMKKKLFTGRKFKFMWKDYCKF